MKYFQIIILVLLCFLFLNDPAWAQDMGGRAQLTFQDTKTEETHSTAFNQLYELRFQKRVSPPIQYRLFLRWEDDLTQLKEKDMKNKLHTQSLNPSFDIHYQSSPFDLRLGLELDRNKIKPTPGEEHLFEQKKFLSRFSWTPEGLPSFSFQLDRKANEDKKLSLDTVETNLNTNLDYTYKAFRFLHAFQFNQMEDKALNYTRKDFDNLGRIDYTDNFLNNRLNITGNYLIDYRKRTELSQAGASISTLTELIPQKGLYSNDNTPLNSTDFPMVDTPALIDRNFTASAGINIGTPGGLSSQNIGINLGRVLTVDEIHISVRNSVGGLVPFGGPITWNVYKSPDGIIWDTVAIGASTFFNATFSRYEISFSPTPARFFKVVNFGINVVETFATEIQSFTHDTFTSGEKRASTFFTQTGNLTTSIKPIERVTLTYDGFINTIKNDQESISSFRSTEWTQGVTALLEPFRFFSTTLRYQKRKLTESEGQSQESDFYSGVLNFYFLKNLDTSFSASQMNEKINGEKSTDSRTFLLHNAAKLYRNWDVSLDLQYQQQKNYLLEQQGTTDTYSITGTSFAQLRKNLTWTLNGTVNWKKTYLVNSIGKRTQDINSYTEFFYRPSQQLNLTARWGYIKAEEQSGFTQRYRFEWMPFPEGALQFTGTYELERDPVSNLSADRYNALLRWNINRYAYLEFNYLYTILKANETQRTQTFYTTFNLNF